MFFSISNFKVPYLDLLFLKALIEEMKIRLILLILQNLPSLLAKLISLLILYNSPKSSVIAK